MKPNLSDKVRSAALSQFHLSCSDLQHQSHFHRLVSVQDQWTPPYGQGFTITPQRDHSNSRLRRKEREAILRTGDPKLFTRLFQFSGTSHDSVHNKPQRKGSKSSNEQDNATLLEKASKASGNTCRHCTPPKLLKFLVWWSPIVDRINMNQHLFVWTVMSW